MKLASDLVLPDRARKFLDELSNALENYEDKIVSIILFGSLVKGGHSALSDVDMIIVVKDEISDSQISEIEEKVRVIEEKNEYRTKPIEKRSISERFVSSLGSFVELRTGMFVSHFICRRKDFLDANFAKIFNTTPVVTELLAPSSLVLSGVLSHAKTIYGEELLNKVKRPEFGLVDILKSLIMNFLLSLGSLFLYIFHSSAGKFAFEATKWSVHSSYFYLSSISANIEDAAKFYISKEVSRKHLENMLSLRKKGVSDFAFVIATIPNVVWIHLATISMSRKKRR